jgi:tripartite-type tricarboxylate transporter receptor subunit TctC
MTRKLMLAMAVMAALLTLAPVLFAGGSAEAKQAGWKPTKPINVIVPWGAGGSTDQITRIAIGELETYFGQKFVAVNQPGASGSVGTRNALDAAHDGYTWAAGAIADLAGYRTLGLLETNLADWVPYLSVANVPVVSVNADSPYKTMDDLLKALKEKGDQIPVATAGVSSAGHVAIESLKKYAKFNYKHVTYDGGNPAVIATVAGEAQVTTQLAVEQADMLRGKKLRALAVLSDKALEIKGYDAPIPPITQWIPEFKPLKLYFGMWIPKDAPKEVIEAMDAAWTKVIGNSEKIKTYALERGAFFDPSFGKAAMDKAFPTIQQVLWIYADAGKAKVSPDTVGYPRP